MKICAGLFSVWLGLFVASASAQSWQLTSAPITNWQAVAASADGTVLAAAFGHQFTVSHFTGGIYVSTNSGIDWFPTGVPDTNFYNGVALSADGTKLAATMFNTAGLYWSTNTGSSWTLRSTPTQSTSPAISANGNLLLALSGSAIYSSTNGGVDWILNNLPGLKYASVASSGDGKKLAAVVQFTSSVFTSTNGGITWVSNNASHGSFMSIASSVDGSRLIAAGNPQIFDGIYTSSDSGLTWTSNSAPKSPWKAVTTSADGTRLAAALAAVYTNSGTVWSSGPTVDAHGLTAIASSADGALLVVTAGNGSAFPGGIYIWRAIPSPRLNMAPSGNSLKISWIVPSTNFVMQQNPALDETIWVTLSNTPALNLTNLQNEVNIEPTNGSGFYRLKTP